jgi:hypothetical protein
MSVLLIGLLLAFVVLGWLYWRFRVPFQVHRLLRVPTLSELEPIAVEPDGPQPFGYKTSWWAVRAASCEAVATALGLKPRRSANWASGVAASYRGWVFVTPPIGGWVLVTSRDLPDLIEHDPASLGEGSPVSNLAARFEEVQCFVTHRVVEYHAWLRFQGGVCVRAYAYLGERGETLINFGEDTPEEEELDYNFDDDDSQLAEGDLGIIPPQVPGEDEVMALAALWSVSPVDLDPGTGGRGVGIVGLLPSASDGGS